MPEIKERVEFGLTNVHYAVIDPTDGTYGTPVRIPGAVTLSLEPEGDSSTFSADNKPYYTATANNGYTGTFECADFPDQAKVDLLGDIIDKAGMVLEDSDAVPAQFALLYEVSANVEPARLVMFNCSLARPSKEHNTKADTVEPDTTSLDFTAIPKTFEWNGGTKNFTKGSLKLTEASKAAYDAFFTAVLEPEAPIE